jgi:hypothetical protein
MLTINFSSLVFVIKYSYVQYDRYQFLYIRNLLLEGLWGVAIVNGYVVQHRRKLSGEFLCHHCHMSAFFLKTCVSMFGQRTAVRPTSITFE